MKRTFWLLLAPLLLAGCDRPAEAPSAASSAEARALLEEIKAKLIFVEGGDFLMGDFGTQYGARKVPYGGTDSRPLHPVTLSSYSIGKFKASNQEYQSYLRLTGQTLRHYDNEITQEDWDSYNRLPDTPAHLDWNEADRYCGWLAEVSGLPFALPTEAQWEYAARSRGQYLALATNNGDLDMVDINRGINIGAGTNRREFANKMKLSTGIYSALPGDSFPPNALGIYDMAANGKEWASDWYDPDYYRTSPRVDPQGPAEPVFKYNEKYVKVARGNSYANGMATRTSVGREYDVPDTKYVSTMTARCVVNQPQPVAPNTGDGQKKS